MVKSPPPGLWWRAHPFFILLTVAIGQFSDIFLYGMVIPVLPYLLLDRLGLPAGNIQSHVSILLAAFSGASLVFAIPAGWLVDWTTTRRDPYLVGLIALTAATILLFVSRVLQGLSAAIVSAAGLAMVIDTTGSNNLGKTLGTIHSLVAIGELGAPPLGGVLFAKSGREGLLAVSMAVLAVDFLMRLFLIEKKPARVYHASKEDFSEGLREEADEMQSEPHCDSQATEEEALLPPKKPDVTKSKKAIRLLPIVYCLTEKRLLVALVLGFVQALVIGTYDATLAIEAAAQFGFSSLETGFLFLAIGLPSLFFAPLGGWAVDRYGTRSVATAGFGFYAPCLALLRLPSQKLLERSQNIAFFCLILALNGICLSVVGTAGIVEANNVVDKFVKADPEFFGLNGPHGQLFGLTTFVFNAGLTLGPLCSGPLRESVGYGNLYATVALTSATAAVLSFMYIGERGKT